MYIGTTFWTGKGGQYAYTDQHVMALRSQVEAQGHSLVVLGNTSIADRPLLEPNKYRGWWSKLEWFRPENADIRPAVVFDLDTFIIGSPGDLLALDPDRLWLIPNFLGRQQHDNSGIFVAPSSEVSDRIWGGSPNFERGDGDYLDTFPHGKIFDEVDGIYSYKASRLHDRSPPPDTRVVCFHGRPKPPEVEGWAKDFWNAHTQS